MEWGEREQEREKARASAFLIIEAHLSIIWYSLCEYFVNLMEIDGKCRMTKKATREAKGEWETDSEWRARRASSIHGLMNYNSNKRQKKNVPLRKPTNCVSNKNAIRIAIHWNSNWIVVTIINMQWIQWQHLAVLEHGDRAATLNIVYLIYQFGFFNSTFSLFKQFVRSSSINSRAYTFFYVERNKFI